MEPQLGHTEDMLGHTEDTSGHQPDIDHLEQVERDLRDALAHLYDPVYDPPASLWRITGCERQQGAEALQRAIIEAIERLEPSPDAPATARNRRVYTLLLQLYVHDRTQDETAQRLGITPRHLRREIPDCVRILALRLLAESGSQTDHLLESSREEATPVDGSGTLSGEVADWQSQIRREIVALSDSAPDMTANVNEALESATRIARALTSKRGIALEAGQIRPNLVAKIHPSVLRQILIAAIGEVADLMSEGSIAVTAQPAEQGVEFIISATPVPISAAPKSEFIQEILTVQDCHSRIVRDGSGLSFHIVLPPAGRLVLIVDDNVDMLHLYRRYVLGSDYRIVHAEAGEAVPGIIEASPPDVIILDVMLPDSDGWQLMTLLHEDPTTKHIPIIVCSVVQEEELALALGAARYLQKPVRREDFIETLDWVLGHRPA